MLVCTHATFRFAVEKFGVEAFDDRLIAVDEFHHVSANPDSRLGDHVRQLMARNKTHLVAMAEPKSPEAERICREDLVELVTAFVQDKQALERGLFDAELVPEELTQVRMGKIVKEKFPNLDDADQEAVRQHAITALNLVQHAKKVLVGVGGVDSQNTALIDGVRKFALSVKELDIDLIDRINPFGEAYAILAKSMSEERLKLVAEVIAATPACVE